MSTIRRSTRIRTAIVSTATALGLAFAGGTASAATPTPTIPLTTDLTADVSSLSFLAFNEVGVLIQGAKVKNLGLKGAAPTTTAFTFAPVTKFTLNNQTYYVPDFNRPVIRKDDSTPALGPFGSSPATTGFAYGHLPYGLNRITVCADSTGVVSEASETNNCAVTIRDIRYVYIG